MTTVASCKRIPYKTGIFFLETPYFNQHMFVVSESRYVGKLGNHFHRENFSLKTDIFGNNNKNVAVSGFELRALPLRIQNLSWNTVVTAAFAIPEFVAQRIGRQLVVFNIVRQTIFWRNKSDGMKGVSKHLDFFTKLRKRIYMFYGRGAHDHNPFSLGMMLAQWHIKYFPSINLLSENWKSMTYIFFMKWNDIFKYNCIFLLIFIYFSIKIKSNVLSFFEKYNF